MKIRLRYLSALLPLVLIATPLYAATPKAGSKCSKAGATSTSVGKKFTCVKSGKKLVWNKGVTVSAPKPVATPTPTPTSYTMQQVTANNKTSSCWSVIDGFVYNLTSWINAHPGGAANIIKLCGIDGTALFKAQHLNQTNPAQRLSSFLLGPLKN